MVLNLNFQFLKNPCPSVSIRGQKYKFPLSALKRHLHRKTTRVNERCLVRRLDRSGLRGRRRGPDDLSQALTAFGRAIRAHRRLARLAPEFFDSALVDREALNRAEQRRWMALWEPALAKVYCGEPQPPGSDANLPPLPPPCTQRAVDRQLAEQSFWMAARRLAMERHQQRYPHALPSWHRLTRLLNLALDFQQLACGLNSKTPLPERITYDYDLTALKRAYPQPVAADSGACVPLAAGSSTCVSPVVSCSVGVSPATDSSTSVSGHRRTTQSWAVRRFGRLQSRRRS